MNNPMMTELQQKTPVASCLRRSDKVRQFIRQDKRSVAILVMAAVVGTLAGLLGVVFEKAVDWVQQQRLSGLAYVANSWVMV